MHTEKKPSVLNLHFLNIIIILWSSLCFFLILHLFILLPLWYFLWCVIGWFGFNIFYYLFIFYALSFIFLLLYLLVPHYMYAFNIHYLYHRSSWRKNYDEDILLFFGNFFEHVNKDIMIYVFSFASNCNGYREMSIWSTMGYTAYYKNIHIF